MKVAQQSFKAAVTSDDDKAQGRSHRGKLSPQ
jgi:hypothetical protein